MFPKEFVVQLLRIISLTGICFAWLPLNYLKIKGYVKGIYSLNWDFSNLNSGSLSEAIKNRGFILVKREFFDIFKDPRYEKSKA